MSNQGLRDIKPPKKTQLYARIMLWVTIPLFILGVLFTGLQLRNQIHSLNQLHQFESEIVFQSVQKALPQLFEIEDQEKRLSSLMRLRDQLQKNSKISEMSVYSLLDNRPVLGETEWKKNELNAVKALLQDHKKNPQRYLVQVDQESRELVAFLPFQRKSGNFYVTKLHFPLTSVANAFNSSRKILVLILGLIILVGFIISQGIAQSILRPIKILEQATRDIIHGNLGKHVKIKTGDEIQALAERFNQMSDTLEEMRRKAADANPLTGLPGNSGIAHELQKRITERQKFVLFHCDLDRFKVFNDHFGLAKGDKAIKLTADLLRRSITERGAQDDFIGHQGGDDFVLITRPNRARDLAEYVCSTFKSSVVHHLYPKDDLDRGHTLQLDRRRQTETGETVMVPFPLLSISLAGISNAKQDFADYADCMARVAPVKKEAKKVVESNYLIQE